MNPIKKLLGKVTLTIEKDVWNINKSYDRITLVADQFGATYISRQDVPAGIDIHNNDYWLDMNAGESLEKLFNEFKAEVDATLQDFGTDFETFKTGVNEAVSLIDAKVRQVDAKTEGISNVANTAKDNSTKALERLDTVDKEIEDLDAQVKDATSNAAKANTKAGEAIQKAEACVKLSDRGKPDGIPILDSNGLIPASQLPIIETPLIDSYLSDRTDAAPTAHALHELHKYHEADIVLNRNLIDAILDAIKDSPEIGVSPSIITIDSKAQDITVQIISKDPWTIENTHTDKVTISPMSGSGNGVITCSFVKNDSKDEQVTGAFKVKTASKEKTITFVQEVAKKTYKYNLEITPPNVDIEAIGGTGSITVVSTKQGYYNDTPDGVAEQVNYTVEVKGGPSWLTLSGDNNKTYTATENTLEASRNATIIVSQSEGGGMIKEVPVVQKRATINTEYIFEITPAKLTINDNGVGKEYAAEIRSQKKVTTNQDVVYSEVGFNVSYDGDCDASWVTHDNVTDKIIIKANEGAKRSGNIIFTQESSQGLKITVPVVQEAGVVDYEYIFEYTPASMDFTKEGGSKTYDVTKSVKRKTINGTPVGVEIDVAWDVKVEGDGFTLDKGQKTVTATENKDAERTGKLIFTRAELSDAGNKEVVITQEAAEITYTYELTGNINPSIVAATGGSFVLNVTSKKQKYINGNIEGSKEDVAWTATSKLGIASGDNTSGATWTVTENLVDEVRNDIITVTQSESNKTLELNLTQSAALITEDYELDCTPNPINLNTNGDAVHLTITSRKRKLINGKPSGDYEAAKYTTSISEGFTYSMLSISANPNNTESIKRGTFTINQTESSKSITVNITQAAGAVTYEYKFDVTPKSLNITNVGQAQTVTVTSTKIKKINGIEYGDAEQVDYTSFVTEGFNIAKNTISAPQNNTAQVKSGTATFRQNESNKEVQVTLSQAAGIITWEYEFINNGSNTRKIKGYLDDVIDETQIRSIRKQKVNGIDTGVTENASYRLSGTIKHYKYLDFVYSAEKGTMTYVIKEPNSYYFDFEETNVVLIQDDSNKTIRFDKFVIEPYYGYDLPGMYNEVVIWNDSFKHKPDSEKVVCSIRPTINSSDNMSYTLSFINATFITSDSWEEENETITFDEIKATIYFNEEIGYYDEKHKLLQLKGSGLRGNTLFAADNHNVISLLPINAVEVEAFGDMYVDGIKFGFRYRRKLS